MEILLREWGVALLIGSGIAVGLLIGHVGVRLRSRRRG
jgi:hypothetical protein